MEYTIGQLTNPTPDDIAQILNLFREIPGRTCSAVNYLDYLTDNWRNLALFIIRKNEKIVGFAQAETPNILDPKCAWLPFACATVDCEHKQNGELLELAENWMRERGATKWKMTTTRKPQTIKRLWGLSKSAETLMEKIL